MNLKKKSVITATILALGLIIITVVSLKFQSINLNSNPAVSEQANKLDVPKPQSASDTLYGSIQTPFPNYRVTPDVSRKDYPVIISQDGKIGYKNKDGKIIVEPIYGLAHEFWNGVGRVRIDNPDGTFTWKSVNLKGKIYEYDSVLGFHCGLSPVSKDGKWGFINYDGELVVPLNYEKLYNAYVEGGRSSYAVKDGIFVYLNLKDGFEEVFEKYDPNKNTKYSRTIDLKDYNLLIANDRLVVNGQSDPEGIHFPLAILQGLNFDLFTQDKKLGTYKAKLNDGHFEGEVFVTFPEYNRPFVNDDYEGYYAVLSNSNSNYREVTRLDNADKYLDTAKQYLKDNSVGNTPISIDIAFEGDFTGNGMKGIALELNDLYRKEPYPTPYKENWTEENFTAGKTAFVNAIIIIDDIKKPLEYRMVKSNIWKHLDDMKIKTETLLFIANSDQDQQLELIISNNIYEYQDYSTVDLK